MPSVNAAPEFTDCDVKLIAGCVPAGVDQWRLELLPRILREWSQTDLPEHLSMSAPAVIRSQLKLLKIVGKRASDLLQALDAIDKGVRFRIAWTMARADRRTRSTLSQTELAAEWNIRLEEESDFLTRLAAAMPMAIPNPGRGRPRNIAAYLVMMDIAAIFEWLTDTTATRQVDRNKLIELGPFWDFAKAIWPVVFGQADHGLPAAMKNWASFRKRYREESALIGNINLRRPTWGVFRK